MLVKIVFSSYQTTDNAAMAQLSFHIYCGTDDVVKANEFQVQVFFYIVCNS